MTLKGFCRLMHHYLKIVIALPVAFTLITLLVFFLTPPTFQAKATLVTNADLNVVGGYAQNEAVTYSQNGITVSFALNPAAQSVEIIADGADYGGCIAAANATVLALSEAVHANAADVMVSVNEATAAITTSQSPFKMVLTAILVGALLAVCIVIMLDIIKTPIKTREDVELSSDLPVLGEIPARDGGEYLLANVRFAAGKTPSTIALVPVGGSGRSIARAELVNALNRAGVKTNHSIANAHAQGLKADQPTNQTSVIECLPLSEGMGAAYIARDAAFTVICVTEWLDSRKVLANVVQELRFAKANLGGVILLVESSPTEDFR